MRRSNVLVNSITAGILTPVAENAFSTCAYVSVWRGDRIQGSAASSRRSILHLFAHRLRAPATTINGSSNTVSRLISCLGSLGGNDNGIRPKTKSYVRL